MELIEQLYRKGPEAKDSFIDSLFETDINGALNLIQVAHSEISSAEPNDHREFVMVLLDSLWNFFKSQTTIFEKADFALGLQQLQSAHKGFEQLNLIDIVGLTTGFELYIAALLDLKNMNLNAGQEKIQKAKAHFESIDKYGKIYGQQVEIMESEGFYISGQHLIAQMDYENAEIAMERAATSSKKIAAKYFGPESQQYYYFMGVGYMYSSIMNFTTIRSKLNEFDFDYFQHTGNEANENSLKALELLANAVEQNEIARINLNVVKTINLLSQVVFEIGKCMQTLLSGKEDEITFEIGSLRAKIKNANKFSRSIGEHGLIFMRIGTELEYGLINVDKFLKFGNKSHNRIVSDKKDIAGHSHKFVSNGDNEKALDYLITAYEGYDQYDNIVTLKAKHSRLKRDQILGQYSKEEYNVEENKITKAILSLIKLL